jgi:DNA-directed RNA polymerase subunit RPC12/RpoP
MIASAANLSKRRVYSMAQAYCMKCKKKVEVKSPKQVTLKNKRAAIQGLCPKCGTKVFRMGKA